MANGKEKISKTASGGKDLGSKLKSNAARRTRSAKANIVFPVSRIQRYLKRGNYSERIGIGASVFLAATLEYLVAEILELAGNAASDNKKSRITPRYLMLAIKNDEELAKLLCGVTIAQGGVLPHIEPVLLTKKTNGKNTSGSQEY
ncbi:histone H2A, sperm-like isoform X2 [Diaphorina citri]|uniref:Histone H2A n=1 Tax=Diaphorina citri TaxID=121845 RepID=A0A1S3DJU2_DIACI|nr:histone H2A, sperm-like isoform X1 [Diaphorina citri]XP_017303583.1 histone H2A, sperm-like isoform X2 [Diaphorina citri]KAI5745104.1 hypothetical protein M8J76_008254 [Diaphorina citri]KAI5751607.1 hypothetical protein M8J77_009110 [Diaphorina citri]